MRHLIKCRTVYTIYTYNILNNKCIMNKTLKHSQLCVSGYGNSIIDFNSLVVPKSLSLSINLTKFWTPHFLKEN